MSRPDLTGVSLEKVNVQGNLNISEVTVNDTSSHDNERNVHEMMEIVDEKLYESIKSFIEVFRISVLTVKDDSLTDDAQNLLVEYIRILRKSNEKTLRMIEALTALGILHRIRGQYFQLLAANNEKGMFPCNFYFYRASLTQKRVDNGHFAEAETCLREALKLCIDKFGVEHRQVLIIENEIGLLYRDRGEYKQAIRQFRRTMSHLKAYHPTESSTQSMLYLNWAMVYRENSQNVRSLYFLWGSRVFGEAAFGKSFPVTSAYKIQKRYNIGFIIMKTFIVGVWAIIFNIFIWIGIWHVVSIAITLAGVLTTKAIISRILIIILAARIEGAPGLMWPPRNLSEILEVLWTRAGGTTASSAQR